jgi:VWFA-related protein
MLRRTLVLLLLPLTAIVASAQTLRETIDVTVGNVEVVVLDRRGNTVEGLAAGDFELFVDGERVPITNFYGGTFEQARVAGTTAGAADAPAGEPEAPQASHLVMVYLDESAFAHQVAKSHMVPNLEKFFASLTSGCGTCRVSLHSRRGRELVTLTPATADASLLGRRLREEMKLQERTALATRNKFNMMRSQPDMAPLYMSLLDSESRKQRHALAEVVGGVADDAGRKILLLVTSLPVLRFPDIASAVAQLPELEGAGGGGGGVASFQPRSMAEALALEPAEYDNLTDLHGDLRGGNSLVTLANAAGVAIYPIISTGLADMDVWSSAERMGAPDPGGRPTTTRLSDLMAGVEALAYATGGRMQPPTNDFRLAFESVGKELRSYYSLGFRMRTEGAVQKIDVRVPRRSELVVRTRSSMKFLHDDERVELAARAASASERGGPVSLVAMILDHDPAGLRDRVKIRFIIPLDQIVWRAGEEGEEAELKLSLKSVGDSGAISEIQTIPMTLRRSFGERQPYFSDDLELAVRKERQDLVVMLEDVHGKTSSWRTLRVE